MQPKVNATEGTTSAPCILVEEIGSSSEKLQQRMTQLNRHYNIQVIAKGSINYTLVAVCKHSVGGLGVDLGTQ